MASVQDELLRLKGGLAEAYRANHGGSVHGFDELWDEKEAELLACAKAICERKEREADEASEHSRIMGQKRSQMTHQQKGEFINEHGLEAFQGLAS